jgi:thiosulfate/3-mercaptopyruvate sulfurtransferase
MATKNCTRLSRREFVFEMGIGAVACACMPSVLAQPLELPPIVSPEWLAQNLGDRKLVIVDIRSAEQYKKNHIPGSLSLPMSSWAVSRDGLSLELPSENSLLDLLGKSGINPGSHVVILNRTDTDFSRADTARVAWTCSYAGIRNTAILDGGYNRWLKEKKATSDEIVNVRPVPYEGKVNKDILASKAYVLGKIGRSGSVLVDTRMPEDYFGISSKPGHIKDSVNLPTPWIFAADGTFRNQDDLRAMAAGVIGDNKSREVILYCGVGGYATTWWFLLTRLFGFRNVKVYDGSMEDWSKDPQDPVRAFTWH